MWLRRIIVAASTLLAGFHVLSTPGIVDPIAVSSLAAEPKDVAIALWHFSSVIFVSIPIALAWSFRAPAERGRPLQVYIAALVAGLSVVVIPIALNAYGLSGLLTLPQSLAGMVLAALIIGCMAPDPDRPLDLAAKQFPIAPESRAVVPR